MTGIICINKEQDITSFGVCAKIRGITREKKCGHAGTLDPLATGVLPVMLGGATRFLDFLPESDKGYRAEFMLGKTTDTFDITGKVTGEYSVYVTEQQVLDAVYSFKGRIMQVPPMYSAVSVGGERLYALARKGIEIEREAREIEIKKLDVISFADNICVMDVFCSKGTYIRSLIDDIGKKLGCGAVMTKLQRTYACGFSLESCTTIAELQRRKDENVSLDDLLIPVEKALSAYEAVQVSAAQSNRFKNGGALDILRLKKKLTPDTLYRVFSPDYEFLGLGEAVNNELKVKRVFVSK